MTAPIPGFYCCPCKACTHEWGGQRIIRTPRELRLRQLQRRHNPKRNERKSGHR
jgi:hypothetical protein